METPPEAASVSSDGYEFTSEQNNIIRVAGDRARMWGGVSLIGGGLVAVIGLWELLFGAGIGMLGVIVYGLLAAAPILIGLNFLKSSRALGAVVTTEGDDIDHLMSSIETLGSALTFQIQAAVLWVVVVVLGLVTTTAIPSFAVELKERAYQTAARADLKDLAAVQHAYHTVAGNYAEELEELDGFSARGGVNITIVTASAGGWAATASHRGSALLGCAIFVGDATAPPTPVGQRPEQRGIPVCD